MPQEVMFIALTVVPQNFGMASIFAATWVFSMSASYMAEF